jgi:hypothetical protein
MNQRVNKRAEHQLRMRLMDSKEKWRIKTGDKKQRHFSF